jgi:isopenicillin-N epimerase
VNPDGFLLDPEIVFLNHGSFGACPVEVLDAYRRHQDELERRPVEFLGRRVEERLAEARAELARFVGARAGDLVFVPNSTAGVNVIARSLELRPGDEVLTTEEEYGACEHAWEHYGATLVRRPVDDLWSGLSDRTRVLFTSHIASETARVLPVADWVRRARAAGLVAVVDGAHAPGQIELDLDALGADAYVGNCHKWLCAPKGSGFLWARPELQERLQSLVVGWGYGEGSSFVTRNERQGTRDPAAYLATPAAIHWLERHGEPERCRELAAECARRVGELTGLPAVEPYAQMVACPLPERDAAGLQRRLLERHSIEVVVSETRKGALLRASFQVYNESSDVQVLLDALRIEMEISPSGARISRLL